MTKKHSVTDLIKRRVFEVERLKQFFFVVKPTPIILVVFAALKNILFTVKHLE